MHDRVRHIKDGLWFLAVCGAIAIAFRLVFGLGATTNLSDAVPWGLWKILNMVAGVALATSGFTVGFLVYVLRMKSMRPLVKPAVLVAFLGYGSSVFALLLDIGLPYRIWHPIFMWNIHSFLFEVAMCVMFYFTVTIIELSPTILERFPKWQPAVHFLHSVAPGVVIVGITLSTLHHTSLGSLFLVTPQRLHPIWFTTWIPLLFITSAIGAGMMVLILVKVLYGWLYDPESILPPRAAGPSGAACIRTRVKGGGRDIPMLGTLAVIAASILTVNFVLRCVDLVRTGALEYVLAGTWESWLYIFAILIGVVLPVTLVAIPRCRRSPWGLAAAGASAGFGLALNRLNVGVFGYFRDAGSVYFPSLTEWAVCIGIFATAALVFLYTVENFPIFDERWKSQAAVASVFRRGFDSFSRVWARALGTELQRVSLIVVAAVPLAWLALYPPYSSAARVGVTPPVATDVQRFSLMIDGDRARRRVSFPHKEHQDRLGGQDSCSTCHHLSLPGDHATPCSRCHRHMESGTRIFNHTAHFTAVARAEHVTGLQPGNHSCTFCHAAGVTKTATSAKPCLDCHRKDMKPAREPTGNFTLAVADGYRVAMHETCIPCHKRESVLRNRPQLGECAHCHGTEAPPGPFGTNEGPVDASQIASDNSIAPAQNAMDSNTVIRSPT